MAILAPCAAESKALIVCSVLMLDDTFYFFSYLPPTPKQNILKEGSEAMFGG